MRTAFVSSCALALSLLAGPAQAQLKPAELSEAEVASLAADLDGLLSNKALKDVRVGVHVLDLATGKALYGRKPDAKLNPASNAKIITAAAALDRFGPSHTFKTELWGGKPAAGVLEGDVALVGGGDPFLLWGDLLEMADRARRKGIKVVKGDLVVVDAVFDDQFMPPAYDQKSEEAAYRAPVGGVSVEFSAMTIIIMPGKEGQAPSVSFEPPSTYAIVDNKATTVSTAKEAAREPLSVKLVKEGERTRVVLRGKTHKGASLRKRVDGPSVYAGHTMKEALRAVGIEVEGKVRRGELPEGLRLLARHQSPTMTYLVLSMQKWSNNFMAESLFKALDIGESPATWAGAQGHTRRFLAGAGLAEGSYTLTNGSGLYDANALSAAQFTRLMAYMYGRHDLWPDFETSFAVAGVDGTLGRRMRGTGAHRVLRGKTGTLAQVITLTGVTRARDGRPIAFSILFNDAKGAAWTYRKIQDEIGARLTRLGSGR